MHPIPFILSLLPVLSLLDAAAAPSYRLQNPAIEAAVDARGNLTSLRSRVSGKDYAGGTGLWRLYYETHARKEIQITPDGQEPEITAGPDSIVIHYGSLICEGTRLAFGMTLTLSLEEDKVRFASRLENREPGTIIRELQYPLVGDLALPEGYKLLTTYTGGTIYDDPRQEILDNSNLKAYMTPAQYFRQLTVQYPNVEIAANCFALFGEQDGLYFGSHDPTFQNTFHGLRLYPDADGVFNRLECGFYKYPNCMAGEDWTCSANCIAPYKGTWCETSRLYRRWADTWMERRDPPQWVKEMRSWQRVIFKHQYGEYFFHYADMPGRVKSVGESVGADALLLFGWWKDGMDHGNPDYVPDPAQGGEAGLKEAIQGFTRDGAHLILYFNGKLIDRESSFYQSGEAADVTLRDNTGAEWLDQYKFTAHGSFLGNYDTRSFSVADPRSEKWRRMMRSWADLAHEYGASCVFYDQMGTVDRAIVHWDRSGEFPVPHLTNIADKAAALKEMRDYITEKYPGMGIGAEHLTDVTAQYVDFVHIGGRRTFVDWFRYTFPEIIVSDRRIRDDVDAVRKVNLTVLQGLRNDIEIYRARDLIDKTPTYQAWLAQVNAVKKEYADLLMNGRFAYHDGFTSSNPHIEVRSFIGDGRMAIVLANMEDKTRSTRVEVPGYRLKEYRCLGASRVGRRKVRLGKDALTVLIYEKES
ncbi:MAG: hypothetical protein IJ721_03170 [Bacteroidales bacterium]|nr:hypothetical protein [Bacteroidales bacterium]